MATIHRRCSHCGNATSLINAPTRLGWRLVCLPCSKRPSLQPRTITNEVRK